jgi:hypothetical protein
MSNSEREDTEQIFKELTRQFSVKTTRKRFDSNFFLPESSDEDNEDLKKFVDQNPDPFSKESNESEEIEAEVN